jgi:predicted N-acetyltransferase YhbS
MLRQCHPNRQIKERPVELRQETPHDYWAVEGLLDLCFAPGRTALSSYRLRDGVPPVADLCLVVADRDGTIGGSIRYWPVQVDGRSALLLGPVAVHPTRQGEGLGAFLIQRSLYMALGPADARVLLVGDAPYYGRFGFERLGNVLMPAPTNPARVLGQGKWAGVAGPVIPAPQPDLP